MKATTVGINGMFYTFRLIHSSKKSLSFFSPHTQPAWDKIQLLKSMQVDQKDNTQPYTNFFGYGI